VYIPSQKKHFKLLMFNCQTRLGLPWTTLGWQRGVVVSGVRHMNEVNARRARLVPGWVTAFGQVYHFGM